MQGVRVSSVARSARSDRCRIPQTQPPPVELEPFVWRPAVNGAHDLSIQTRPSWSRQAKRLVVLSEPPLHTLRLTRMAHHVQDWEPVILRKYTPRKPGVSSWHCACQMLGCARGMLSDTCERAAEFVSQSVAGGTTSLLHRSLYNRDCDSVYLDPSLHSGSAQSTATTNSTHLAGIQLVGRLPPEVPRVSAPNTCASCCMRSILPQA